MNIDRSKVLVVADDIVTGGVGLVLGANEEDYHLTNVQYGRDYTADVTGDVVSAYDGASCPLCQMNLDVIQFHTKEKVVPVFYFTELLRIAFEGKKDVRHSSKSPNACRLPDPNRDDFNFTGERLRKLRFR